MATAPTDFANCTRCGKRRAVNRGKKRGPTPLCRDCTVQEELPCPCCSFVGNRYALANHRRWHCRVTP